MNEEEEEDEGASDIASAFKKRLASPFDKLNESHGLSGNSHLHHFDDHLESPIRHVFGEQEAQPGNEASASTPLKTHLVKEFVDSSL